MSCIFFKLLKYKKGKKYMANGKKEKEEEKSKKG